MQTLVSRVESIAARTPGRIAIGEYGRQATYRQFWEQARAFAELLDYVPLTAGAGALKAAVQRAEASLGAESRRLHGQDMYGMPSRFLREIPPHLLHEVRPKVQVSRPVYGSAPRAFPAGGRGHAPIEAPPTKSMGTPACRRALSAPTWA